MNETEFEKLTGRTPQNDDMHRVNCDTPGVIGHLMCGACDSCGKPRMWCGGCPEPNYNPTNFPICENDCAPHNGLMFDWLSVPMYCTVCGADYEKDRESADPNVLSVPIFSIIYEISNGDRLQFRDIEDRNRFGKNIENELQFLKGKPLTNATKAMAKETVARCVLNEVNCGYGHWTTRTDAQADSRLG